MKINKNKIINLSILENSLVLSFVLLVTPLTLVSVNENIKFAKEIKKTNISQAACDVPANITEEKLPYIFMVSDKLKGDGFITISLEGNKITGKAKGIGTTGQYDVDFETEINGVLNGVEYIDVKVHGIGDPQGLIPGKISFSGPLKGSFENEKLLFSGRVNIEGKLAKCAGFNDTEIVTIEISNSSIINSQKPNKKSQELASL